MYCESLAGIVWSCVPAQLQLDIIWMRALIEATNVESRELVDNRVHHQEHRDAGQDIDAVVADEVPRSESVLIPQAANLSANHQAAHLVDWKFDDLAPNGAFLGIFKIAGPVVAAGALACIATTDQNGVLLSIIFRLAGTGRLVAVGVAACQDELLAVVIFLFFDAA
ncbi:hypothetical protein PG995_014811 [Apiospora arundinis]